MRDAAFTDWVMLCTSPRYLVMGGLALLSAGPARSLRPESGAAFLYVSKPWLVWVCRMSTE
jgi:hypothetical protein